MTNQTETRPSDEMTAGVVAKQMEWDEAILSSMGGFISPQTNAFGEIILDPRDDTDSALQVLHCLIDYLDIEHKDEKAMYVMSHDFDGKGIWTIWDSYIGNDYHSIPLSGQPFRYAVVRLAAKAMGIEEVDDG